MITDNTVIPGPQIPISKPTRKPVLLYLIGFLVICLTLFVIWGGYKLYRIKYPFVGVGVYACSPDGYCVLTPKQSIGKWCTIYFESENCDNQCDNPKNRCSQ